MDLMKAYRTQQETGDAVVDATVAALKKITKHCTATTRLSSLERFETLEAAVEDAKKAKVWKWMTAAQQLAGRKRLAEIYVRAHYFEESFSFEFVPFGKTVVLPVRTYGQAHLYDELCRFRPAFFVGDEHVVVGLETEGCCSKCGQPRPVDRPACPGRRRKR